MPDGLYQRTTSHADPFHSSASMAAFDTVL
jgi:hypothetical protein